MLFFRSFFRGAALYVVGCWQREKSACVFYVIAFQSEDVFIIRKGFFDTVDRNAQMPYIAKNKIDLKL